MNIAHTHSRKNKANCQPRKYMKREDLIIYWMAMRVYVRPANQMTANITKKDT